MGNGGRPSRPIFCLFTVQDGGDPAARSSQCSLLCPHPSPVLLPSPCTFTGVQRPQTKPQLFALCPPSLQIPAVCWRLALGDNGERGGQGLTGVCPSVNGAFFLSGLSLSFFSLLLPGQSCVFKVAAPTPRFSSNTQTRVWGQTCYI